jgi:transglutaminase-like putative cysteine protease
MHAWAQVWCEGFWHSFDPTLGRAVSAGSVAVATGRDYYDCAPHQGSYRGEAQALIHLHCATTTSAIPTPKK